MNLVENLDFKRLGGDKLRRDACVESCPLYRSMSEPTRVLMRNDSLLVRLICCVVGVRFVGHFHSWTTPQSAVAPAICQSQFLKLPHPATVDLVSRLSLLCPPARTLTIIKLRHHLQERPHAVGHDDQSRMCPGAVGSNNVQLLRSLALAQTGS